jgi:putative tryptophan/tyrosine transport system substrate-binding protein
MDRRTFLAGAACLSAPIIVVAQAQRKTWRIGYLGGNEQGGQGGIAVLENFRDGMGKLGYVEGRDYVLEVRWSRGSPERSLALATELVGLKVDVIVAAGSEAARAAKQASASIPIVFSGPSYPVEEGLVASFARPGGNVTGATMAMSDTVAKHLQLLRDVVPTLADVAVTWSPANPGNTFVFRDTESVAASLRLKIQSVPISSADDVDAALVRIARLKPSALIVQPSAALALDDVQRIAELAVKLRIPSITVSRTHVERGLLMSYGSDIRDLVRVAAGHVDRLIKGAKAADLPVERPTKFEFVINMKIARAIGATIPQSLLLRANEVIQ